MDFSVWSRTPPYCMCDLQACGTLPAAHIDTPCSSPLSSKLPHCHSHGCLPALLGNAHLCAISALPLLCFCCTSANDRQPTCMHAVSRREPSLMVYGSVCLTCFSTLCQLGHSWQSKAREFFFRPVLEFTFSLTCHHLDERAASSHMD